MVVIAAMSAHSKNVRTDGGDLKGNPYRPLTYPRDRLAFSLSASALSRSTSALRYPFAMSSARIASAGSFQCNEEQRPIVRTGVSAPSSP